MNHCLFIADLILLFGVHFCVINAISSLNVHQKLVLAWIGEIAFVILSGYVLSFCRLLGSPNAWITFHGIYIILLSSFILIKIIPNYPLSIGVNVDDLFDAWADAPGWSRTLFVAFAAAFLLLIAHNLTHQSPYNDDARGYHLPRVRQYIEQNSLNAYPTPDMRRTDFPLNYEILMVWSQVLTKDLRWVYALQWFMLAFAALSLYSTGRMLGFDRAVSLTIALLWLATPYLLLQSTFIKNDAMVACIASCLLPFAIDLRRSFYPSLAAISACLGIGVGTKYIAFFLLPGAAIYLFTSSLREKPRIRKLAAAVALLTVSLVFLGSYSYLDTWKRTGNPVANYEGGGDVRLQSIPINSLRLFVEMSDSIAFPNELVWRTFDREIFDLRTPTLNALSKCSFTNVYDAPSFWSWKNPNATLNLTDRYFQFSLGHLFLLIAGIIYSAKHWLNTKAGVMLFLFGVGFLLQASALKWQPIDNLRFYFPFLTLLYPLMGFYLQQKLHQNKTVHWLATLSIVAGMAATLVYLYFLMDKYI